MLGGVRSPDSARRRYVLYGLCVRSDWALAQEEASDRPFDVEFIRAEPSTLPPFELVPATRRYENASAGVELHESHSVYCLCYPSVADFFVTGLRRVVCHLNSNVPDSLVVELLKGPVCALLLELRGTMCLHASAVAIGGRAVAFLGHSGAGKSTLAAQLVVNGCPLLTDDILPLSLDSGICWATPGCPQIKLRPQPGEKLPAQLSSADCGSDREMRECSGKTVFPLAQEAGEFIQGRLPVGIVYVLERDSQQGSEVSIQPLEPSNCLVELLRYSFCARVVGPLGLEGDRFCRLGGITGLINLRRLQFASGFRALERAVRAVIADAKGPSSK